MQYLGKFLILQAANPYVIKLSVLDDEIALNVSAFLIARSACIIYMNVLPLRVWGV